MRRRLFAVYLLIVLAPLGAVAWLGYRIARDERRAATHQFRSLLEERLLDLARTVRGVVEEEERGLSRALDGLVLDPNELRSYARSAPLVRHGFVLGANGRLRFPTESSDASASERAFLERTAAIWAGDAILYEPPRGEVEGSRLDVPSGSVRQAEQGAGRDSLLDLAARREQGWVAWHWKEGLHLLFWRRRATGEVVGVEVDRVALLSRIVGRLPTSELREGRILLTDPRGDAVVQWGIDERDQPVRADVKLALEYPLDAWHVEYYASPVQRASFIVDAFPVSGALGVGALVLALLGLAAYFHRESSREMREAAQRVSFVTQISHELKTPLANIRLYAELLLDRLGDEDPGAADRLGVVVSECQRLTRLIDNILAFSKHRRGTLSVDRVACSVDEIVRSVLDQFAPALDAKRITVRAELRAGSEALADPDAVGQILSNLVSNVEKYGRSGGRIEIVSSEEDGRIVVRVKDDGPGIPRAHRSRVFDPFYRVNDCLTEGVSGTGIGLAIARELARKNGGDLVLEDADGGASFKLSLEAEGRKEGV